MHLLLQSSPHWEVNQVEIWMTWRPVFWFKTLRHTTVQITTVWLSGALVSIPAGKWNSGLKYGSNSSSRTLSAIFTTVRLFNLREWRKLFVIYLSTEPYYKQELCLCDEFVLIKKYQTNAKNCKCYPKFLNILVKTVSIYLQWSQIILHEKWYGNITDIPNKTKKAPPMTGSGIVRNKAPNFVNIAKTTMNIAEYWTTLRLPTYNPATVQLTS